jgi:hypothetical protein
MYICDSQMPASGIRMVCEHAIEYSSALSLTCAGSGLRPTGGGKSLGSERKLEEFPHSPPETYVIVQKNGKKIKVLYWFSTYETNRVFF